MTSDSGEPDFRPTLTIKTVELEFSMGDDHVVTVEIDEGGLRVWDAGSKTCRRQVCGEHFTYKQTNPRAASPDLDALPHLVELRRALRQSWRSNRGNPLGDFVAPALNAINAAVDAG